MFSLNSLIINMKNLKTIQNLHIKAYELLDLAQQSNEKYNDLLRYNIEVAAPNGFTPKPDEAIEFQMLVTKKLMTSYFRIINEIKSFEL